MAYSKDDLVFLNKKKLSKDNIRWLEVAYNVLGFILNNEMIEKELAQMHKDVEDKLVKDGGAIRIR